MDEQRLFKSLGRIETKIETLCKHDEKQDDVIKKISDKLDQKFDALPCADHYKEFTTKINAKVGWHKFFIIVGALFSLALGAYAYTYKADANNDQVIHEHTTDLSIHRTEGTVRALKE